MTKKPPRKPTPPQTETAVLAKSARRCALCFHLNGDLSEKLGQIAHLDNDRSNALEDNLAFMCLAHHSLFDSRTSQHKNYTIPEVKDARARLYELVAQGNHLTPTAALPYLQLEADRRTFRDFLVAVPSNRTIKFIKEHDFGGSFWVNSLHDIEHYTHAYCGPEHEFLDTELESSRRRFLGAWDNFMSAQVGSVYTAVGNIVGVPKEWQLTQPERYEEAVKTLNDVADELYKAYDQFVRLARRKLAI